MSAPSVPWPVCSNARSLGAALLAPAIEVDARPQPAAEGDLLLCEVTEIGAYDHVENLDGYPVPLRPGDMFVGVAGWRESARSLCGAPPAESVGPADLLNNGGIVGRADPPPPRLDPLTRLRCHGVLRRGAARLNTLAALCSATSLPAGWLRGRPHLLVLGTGAELGKTTLCGQLIRLAEANNLPTLAMKIAGSGRARDRLSYVEAGCREALDFVDFGLPSTYTDRGTYVSGMAAMAAACQASAAAVVISEAGGDSLAGHVDTYLALLSPEDWRTTTCVVVASDLHGLVGFDQALGHLIQRPWYYLPSYLTNATAMRRRKADRLPGVPYEFGPDTAPMLWRQVHAA